ncbi:MAG TPA: helix-turn-helix transcriptional regulator [Clostridiales bacterium]|nr:helix-turn-helix transcriptional regulator [Clostridiales bacterium]
MKAIGNVELFFKGDPYNFAIKAFCTRWKPFLIKAIGYDETTRFNRFTKQLPISEKVLTENLRELEADGLITRTVYAEVPPRVEYKLTELGRSVCPILEAIYDWGWNEMKRLGLPIDPLGEMWHGYRERDEKVMESPFKR